MQPPGHAFKMVPSSVGTEWPTPVAGDGAIAKAAEILNAGEKIAILVGQGARGARDEVLEVADFSVPAWPRRCSAKMSWPMISRSSPAHRPAGYPAQLRDDDGLRHRPHRSARTSPTRSSCPNSIRPEVSRSTGTVPSSGCATPTS